MTTYRHLPIENKLVRILVWTLSSMSLLNLIIDFNFVSLVGKLKEWADAYGIFVHEVASFLFGWIDIAWISIEKAEVHLLIITVLFFSAYGRAEYRVDRYGKYKSSTTDALIYMFSMIGHMLLFVLVPILLLPGVLGIIGGTIGFFFISYVTLESVLIDGNTRKLIHEKSFITFKEIKEEILGVLAIFVLLIVVNHFFFTITEPKKIITPMELDLQIEVVKEEKQYVVQYMALKNKKSANLKKKELEEENFSSFIYYKDPFHIVNIGYFVSKEKAEDELVKVRKAFPDSLNAQKAYVKKL